MQLPQQLNSVKTDSKIVKLKDTVGVYTDCNNYVDSVNSINGVSNPITSNCISPADSVGVGDQYNSFLDSSNLVSTVNCVHPSVVGDTNSWTESKFTQLNHESWCNNYNSQVNIQDSTIFLSDLTGKLVGTCTRMSPNIVQQHRQNARFFQSMKSITYSTLNVAILYLLKDLWMRI